MKPACRQAGRCQKNEVANLQTKNFKMKSLVSYKKKPIKNHNHSRDCGHLKLRYFQITLSSTF
jgi:hypothetical protein